MKSVIYFLTFCIMMVAGSCSKSKDSKESDCSDCLFPVLYNCEREGGKLSFTVNGQQQGTYKGYIIANNGNPPRSLSHSFYFGIDDDCSNVITATTRSIERKIGVEEYYMYQMGVSVEDFCGASIWVGGLGNGGSISITNYDGKNASGTFQLNRKTGGKTQCKPDEWVIEGVFEDIPVY